MQKKTILSFSFFNHSPLWVAKNLLGKIIYFQHHQTWLSVRITETEAYYINDKASHSWLGYTEKRRALFMPAGTIYMYHSQGGPSINISCRGDGNAVLIKSGVPYPGKNFPEMIKIMQKLNPKKDFQPREIPKLCSGQALLCKSLGLTVAAWDKKQFDPKTFYIADLKIVPNNILQTTRIGIAKGRDEKLPYRFMVVDAT